SEELDAERALLAPLLDHVYAAPGDALRIEVEGLPPEADGHGGACAHRCWHVRIPRRSVIHRTPPESPWGGVRPSLTCGNPVRIGASTTRFSETPGIRTEGKYIRGRRYLSPGG